MTMRAGKQAKLDAGLTRLETLTPAGLRIVWEAQEGGLAPGVTPTLLRRLIVQRLQERQIGGLPALIVRELERTARDGALPPAPAPVTRTLTGCAVGPRVAGQDYRGAGHR
jgi:hypothetical protein